MQCKLVLIFQVRTGGTYINVDGNSIYNVFMNVFIAALELDAPLKKSSQTEKNAVKPWLTKKLRKEIAEKRRCGKRTQRSKCTPVSNIRVICLIGV